MKPARRAVKTKKKAYESGFGMLIYGLTANESRVLRKENSQGPEDKGSFLLLLSGTRNGKGSPRPRIAGD